MNRKWINFTMYFLDITFYISVIGTIAFPFLLKIYGKYVPEAGHHYWIFCIAFMFAGFFGILILCALRKMMRSVKAKNCFIPENVAALRAMSHYSFCIGICMIVRLFAYVSAAVLLILLVFLVAGLFSMVLSMVFEEAVAHKQENDLTI